MIADLLQNMVDKLSLPLAARSRAFVSDRNLNDFLRLTQIALHRTNLKSQDIPEFTDQLVNEFPIGERC